MKQEQSSLFLNNPLISSPVRLYTTVLIVLAAIAAAWPLLETQSFADRTIGGFALADVNLNSRKMLYMLGIGIAFVCSAFCSG
jgi:hypothetical protein